MGCENGFRIAADGKRTAAVCSTALPSEAMEKCGADFAAGLLYYSRWMLKEGMQRSTGVSLTQEEAVANEEEEDDWESDDHSDCEEGRLRWQRSLQPYSKKMKPNTGRQ